MEDFAHFQFKVFVMHFLLSIIFSGLQFGLNVETVSYYLFYLSFALMTAAPKLRSTSLCKT